MFLCPSNKNTYTMASFNYCNLVPIFSKITLLLMIFYPLRALSQAPNSSSQCTSSLVPLIPCAPFVQGNARSPGPQCCDNLKQLYGHDPFCLCLLLNNTTLSSFPINRTLAMQLPPLCALQVNVSICPGEHLPVPPISPVSLGSKNNSTVAASPAFGMPPRAGVMGIGFGRSHAISLKAEKGLFVAMTTAILLLTVLY